ncbi:DUF4143 domain-containing protein [Candidatus Rhabdochlamydia porcellionis]|uniref:DUF4143 domain-containing protein n=1 Tax=Candidatus Rhabdochlamydia porcellionis TaxID=225148 RepID=UPI0018E092C1
MSCICSPSLYYWQREKKGAEIDYIIQHENQVIPLEVKVGSTGTLKSLHQFMKEKKQELLSGLILIYLLGQLHRLIKSSEK